MAKSRRQNTIYKTKSIDNKVPCKFRFNETRGTKDEMESGKVRTLFNRCQLREYSRSDRKCLFPKCSHKTCPLVKSKMRSVSR